MKFNILITGGAGYIGSHVAHLLIDNGHSVIVIDSLVTGNKSLVPNKAKLYICDISNEKDVLQIIRKHNFDIVMHFAGLVRVDESIKDPEKYNKFNFENTKIFLKICFKNNIKKVIFSSTASVYGNLKKGKASENDSLNPLNPYALSKLNVEKFIIEQSKKIPIKYNILRYFNVAGADPKMRTGLISKFSTHLIKVASEVAVGKREELIINGNDYNTFDGTTIRDFIHVSDLAEIHYLCFMDLMKNENSNIFNCGYGTGYSVKEVIQCLSKILDSEVKIRIGKRRVGDIEKLIANSEKFSKYFSWTPKFNNLEQIIKTSINWEKKINSIN